jgi:hypothetical protein
MDHKYGNIPVVDGSDQSTEEVEVGSKNLARRDRRRLCFGRWINQVGKVGIESWDQIPVHELDRGEGRIAFWIRGVGANDLAGAFWLR